MCCIYATLFAVVIYFCPRLINLMRPSLQRHRGLAVRLIVATSVCILIFGIHCINYARLVIAPPRKVYWWYQYGSYYDTTCAIFPVCKHRVETYSSISYISKSAFFFCKLCSFVTGILELIPAITFLFIMHPQMNPVDRSYSPTPEIQHRRLIQSGSGVIRVDSSLRAPEFEGVLNNSSSSHIRRDTPLVSQHKGNMGYGAVTTGSNEVSTKI